jgi:hypothetical protein
VLAELKARFPGSGFIPDLTRQIRILSDIQAARKVKFGQLIR